MGSFMASKTQDEFAELEQVLLELEIAIAELETELQGLQRAIRASHEITINTKEIPHEKKLN